MVFRKCRWCHRPGHPAASGVLRVPAGAPDETEQSYQIHRSYWTQQLEIFLEWKERWGQRGIHWWRSYWVLPGPGQVSPEQGNMIRVLRNSVGGSWCCWVHKGAYNRFFLKPLLTCHINTPKRHTWSVFLWHRHWFHHIKTPPIRAQYLDRSRAMKVIYSTLIIINLWTVLSR